MKMAESKLNFNESGSVQTLNDLVKEMRQKFSGEKYSIIFQKRIKSSKV